MKLWWRKRRINFCFRYQKYISIFVNYMLQRIKLIPQRIYVKLCKDQPVDFFRMFVIFSKVLWGSGRDPPWTFNGISFGSLKIWSPVQIFGQSYENNLIDFSQDQVLSHLLLKQSNSFRFLRQYYHYYQRYINLAAIKIHKHF